MGLVTRSRDCFVKWALIAHASGSLIPESRPPFTFRNTNVLYRYVERDLSLNQPIKQGVRAFFGMPFAKPPLGDLRFHAPMEDPNAFSEPLFDATTERGFCLQAPTLEGSEDCLYLNVFMPISASSSNLLPVMVWIYGGAYMHGSTEDYDGSALASHENVIVVTMNYRLGLFGFLASQGSFEESGTTGNWGMLDQAMALKWVEKNIQSFGGDPSRITLFGESAGAYSVLWHLVSPLSTTKLVAAIAQSPSASSSAFYLKAEHAYKFYDWVARRMIGCSSASNLECLRAAPIERFKMRPELRDEIDAAAGGDSGLFGVPEELLASPLFPEIPVGPVIDGVALLHTPLDTVQNHPELIKYRIPMIIGHTQHEGSAFYFRLNVFMRPKLPVVLTPEAVEHTIRYTSNNNEALMDRMRTSGLLPCSSSETSPSAACSVFRRDLYKWLTELLRLGVFACSVQDFGKAYSQNVGPVYLYNFAFDIWTHTFRQLKFGFFEKLLGDMNVGDVGAFHSGELPFVFKHFINRLLSVADFLPAHPHGAYMTLTTSRPGDVFHKVSDIMTCFWANLAVCGSPNCRTCPNYSGEVPQWLELRSQAGGMSSNSSSGQGSASLTGLEIRPNGDFVVAPVTTSSQISFDAAFPSEAVCRVMHDYDMPFRPLNQHMTAVEVQ